MSSTQEVSEQLARCHFTAACSGFHLLHAYMSGLISLCVAAGAQDERFLPRMKASSRIVSLSLLPSSGPYHNCMYKFLRPISLRINVQIRSFTFISAAKSALDSLSQPPCVFTFKSGTLLE